MTGERQWDKLVYTKIIALMHSLFIYLLIGSGFMALFSTKEATLPARIDDAPTEELFISTKVWNIHLEFTRENWEAMDPQKLMDPSNGSGTGFGYGGFIAPVFLAEGDRDGDRRISRSEFEMLAKRWYSEWQGSESQTLDTRLIGQGLGNVHNQVTAGKIHLNGVEGSRNGIASVLGLEFPETTTDLDFEDMPFESVAIRHKGNGTFLNAMGTNKLPFKLDLNDGYPGRDLAGVVKLNLHNNITDPTYMNEVIAHQLFRDAGVPAPRTSYAKVYVTVPDLFDREYFGLYSIVENVDKRFIQDRFDTKKGAIFKPVTPSLFHDLGDDWRSYHQIYDPKTKLTEQEKWRLIDFCRLVTHASDSEFASRIGDFIDMENAARFLAVSVLICDLDGILGPGQNFYLYLDPANQRFTFIPWDQDHSFGQMKRTQEQRENLSLFKPWEKENIFLERLFSVTQFKELYLTYLKEFNHTIFQPERISKQIDQLAESIRPAIRDDSPENLEMFNRLVALESHHSYANVLPERGPDDPAPSPGSFGSDPSAKPIRGFVAARTTSVEDQLAGRSEGMSDKQDQEGNQNNQMWLAGLFMNALDSNEDQQVSESEFYQGFENWYNAWTRESGETLTERDVKRGLNLLFASSE